ncbi:BAG family molecular chaperone regulator 4 [Heracleum sosnowskyi]|uniref:BAG family molecular chaperone regulator 4 n=1 Tax=Heracleum sosnowskyi TaxID=360622 RepID=A0AAD8GN56_9APIA|nr:BAG family molecular chaperone regulator 4 [Heracleum sosnowskyi]
MSFGGNESGGCRSNSVMKIEVCYGSNWLDLVVTSHATFGDLKEVIAKKIGLAPDCQKLFFRGIEERDDECLKTAGLKNNSKLLLRNSARNRVEEVSTSNDRSEEVKVTQISKGSELVAEVKADNDKLAAQVGALKTVICDGHKVLEKDINFVVEMLERQLLKLDGIKAEGEGKVQRKMEVCRVQSLLDTADDLKRRNSGSNAKSSDDRVRYTFKR